jgi:anti-sigma regulatory factor (Ser/Thr protein kinase)
MSEDAFTGDDFDLVEFLHALVDRCVEQTGAQAAGVLFADQPGGLELLASSAGQADLAALAEIHAVPVRLRGEVIGVLTLYGSAPGTLTDADLHTARALADLIGPALHQQSAAEVQRAVAGRVVVEQAKGVVAELLGLDVPGAFTELRRCARVAGRRLTDVAADIVADGGLPPAPAADRSQVLLIRRIRQPGLRGLRADFGAATARQGLTPPRRAAFTLAVHEAAGNTLDHGGGTGQLIAWRRAGDLFAEISDRGPGLPAGFRISAEPPGTRPDIPRGLWIIKRICAGLDIDTGPAGTRLLLRFALDSPAQTEPVH